MTAQFISSCLQIVFTFMQPAGRSFQSCVAGIGREPRDDAYQPRQIPATGTSDPAGKIRREPVTIAKHCSIKQRDRPTRFVAPVPRCVVDRDLHSGIEKVFRSDRPQQATHWVCKIAVEQILKLRVPKNREQFRYEFDVATPCRDI